MGNNSWGRPMALVGISKRTKDDKIRQNKFRRNGQRGHFSFHPSLGRRFTFLGFEFYWKPDRQGVPRVKRRTACRRLQAACRRIATSGQWIVPASGLTVVAGGEATRGSSLCE